MKNLLLLLFLIPMFGGAQDGTLIVLNKSDDTVDLIDIATKESKATLPTGDGPHEVAISEDGNTAVVTNYGRKAWPGHSLTVIDIPSKKVVKTISLEYKAPHGIEFIDKDRVLVTCEDSKKLIQVNIDSGKTEKAIDTEQETSHMVSYAPKVKRAFVANIRSGSVSVIDLKNDVLEKVIKTGNGAEGIALSADGNEVWVTNRGANNIVIIDVSTLETTKTLVSEKFPIRAKATSDGKYILVSNAQSGDINVFDAKTRSLVKTIAMDITVEEKEASRLFQDFDKSPVPVGILVHPNNQHVFVANTNADIITVIDLNKMGITGRLTAGKEPDGLGFSNTKF
ncbi:YncE family protein [Sungkyunkwania multivorans]|uniref:YncE family protein n=1 Tax=Sungkyunkwania multivorans TaxID=1173618 RepID=A0ABW3CXN6_9FLAO